MLRSRTEAVHPPYRECSIGPRECRAATTNEAGLRKADSLNLGTATPQHELIESPPGCRYQSSKFFSVRC